MDWEFLEPLREDWSPVSKPARIGWLVFYAIFLLYALNNRTGTLLIDYVFLPIHEGGHLLFSYFGHTLMVAGGTILQLGVPLLLAIYFAFQRQPTGVAFCSFFFFENFLNVATYMADSRRMELQYVTVGDPDLAEHDWFSMFSQMGVLEYDTKIATVVRLLGWLGMIAVVLWLSWKTKTPDRPPDSGV
ncbi:MAG TPA: hypothetical protein VKM93_27815 [Terriglobia bacterium]|nr:hypothetical protein [Terriglobia bacterium]